MSDTKKKEKKKNKVSKTIKLTIVNGIKVLKYDHTDKHHRVMWKCICPYCGKKFVARGSDIMSCHTRSCGCLSPIATTTHKMKDTRIYRIYNTMISRCYNKNRASYEDYGGRGIYVDKPWRNDNMTPQEVFEMGNPGFMNFYNWSMLHGYDETKTLERVDNDGPYAPWNCAWITPAEQQMNKRTNQYINDGKHIMIWAEFCRKYNLSNSFVGSRVNRGWSLDAIVYAAKNPDIGLRQLPKTKPAVYVDKDGFRRMIPKIKDQCIFGHSYKCT